jgi:hypothetical protein
VKKICQKEKLRESEVEIRINGKISTWKVEKSAHSNIYQAIQRRNGSILRPTALFGSK